MNNSVGLATDYVGCKKKPSKEEREAVKRIFGFEPDVQDDDEDEGKRASRLFGTDLETED